MIAVRKMDTDILIIGGGSSGLWAAKRAKELYPALRVLIVDKGPRDQGGLMQFCGGDFDMVMPDENVDDWVEELTEYWDGLCDQALVRDILLQSHARFSDYEKMGCRFFKNQDGSYRSVPQRGMRHCRLYPAQFKGTGGHDMVSGMITAVSGLGVERMGRVMMTDLFKCDDGSIGGAVGFDIATGDYLVIGARAVLISTGQAEWKPAYSQNTATGEGIEMAFRAGAPVQNFEFIKVWNVPKDFTWEGQTTLLPLGGRFVNRLGEPIMDRYMPSLGSNTDPHYITRAMALEFRAGRAPIYMDTSQIRPEDMELLVPQSGWQLVNYNKAVAKGLDLFHGMTEWIPHPQDTCGALCADLYGRTEIPGLYSAGRARSIDPGVYIGGFAMCTTAVTGYLAGEALAAYAAGRTSSPVPDTWAEERRREIYAPTERSGPRPAQILDRMREILFPYDVCILKTEKSLTRALEQTLALRDGAYADMSTPDTHYLMKGREVKGMILALELYLRASLARRESRAGHFRADFPHRDGGPRWLVIRRGTSGPELSWKRVPTEEYPFPVDKYYSDRFVMG